MRIQSPAHPRFDDLIVREPVHHDTDHASLIESDVPFVARRTRLNSRRPNVAHPTMVGFDKG